ncbi:MAG: hypothetical protein ACR2QH_01630 [Geminicoccaceae bacterium]
MTDEQDRLSARLRAAEDVLAKAEPVLELMRNNELGRWYGDEAQVPLAALEAYRMAGGSAGDADDKDVQIAALREALQPFADFAVRKASKEYIITLGSAIAQRQLTMGDCFAAKDALAATPADAMKRVRAEVLEEAETEFNKAIDTKLIDPYHWATITGVFRALKDAP